MVKSKPTCTTLPGNSHKLQKNPQELIYCTRFCLKASTPAPEFHHTWEQKEVDWDIITLLSLPSHQLIIVCQIFVDFSCYTLNFSLSRRKPSSRNMDSSNQNFLCYTNMSLKSKVTEEDFSALRPARKCVADLGSYDHKNRFPLLVFLSSVFFLIPLIHPSHIINYFLQLAYRVCTSKPGNNNSNDIVMRTGLLLCTRHG